MKQTKLWFRVKAIAPFLAAAWPLFAYNVAAAALQWSASKGGNDHWYEIIAFTNSVTWETAQADAKDRGGYVATITSMQEQSFLEKSLLPQSPDGPESFDAWGWWLGAGKSETSGQWSWSNGEAFSFSAWATNQPDSSGQIARLAIFAQDATAWNAAFELGRWDDVVTENAWLIHGYILEYEQHDTTPTYQVVKRFDPVDAVDVASFDDATFLATAGGFGLADEDLTDLYQRQGSTLNFSRIIQFPRNPVSLNSRPVRFARFTQTGLSYLLDPELPGVYRSLYLELLPGAGTFYSVGGVFTIGGTDFGIPVFGDPAFRDPIGAPTAEEPVALAGNLVFCQSYGFYPSVHIYRIDSSDPFSAVSIAGLSGTATAGALDLNTDQIIVLLAGVEQPGGEPTRLVRVDLHNASHTVVCAFPTNGGMPTQLTMTTDINGDGFLFGTYGFLANKTASNFVWRVGRDGKLDLLLGSGLDNDFRPRSVALGADGWIYGVSDYGGSNRRGSIFRFRSDGTDFQTRWFFRKAESKGAYPFKIIRDDGTNGTAFFILARYEDSDGYDGYALNGRAYTVGYYQEKNSSTVVRPSITIDSASPNAAVFLRGDDNSFYTVETSKNLVHWESLGDAWPGQFGVPIAKVTNTVSAQFFRARTANPP